jgi:bifunctional UDP-N-acetylglucosamine pyrophosphorylase / glucosamine-1-phosphate N-acetyltransferase
MKNRIIILAGGKGSRMNISIPKVLCPLEGKPILAHLLDNLEETNIPIILVVGFQGEKVQQFFGDKYDYVWQKKQLGTGHAIYCAKDKLKDFDGSILTLYGDHPLLKGQTINNIFDFHNQSKAKLTLATTKVSDFNDWRMAFFQFGRIIRKNKKIIAIRELVDCNEKEKLITEVNPSCFCFDSQWLWENIEKLDNKNNQNEYYLTDLIALAFDQNIKINTIEIDPVECLGINNQEQLNKIKQFL